MAAAPRAGTHTESRFERKNQIKSTKNVALHFRANATPLQAKSMTYATSTRANCRRWARRRGEGRHCRGLGHRHLGRDLVFGRRALQFLELQLDLIEKARRAFRAR